MKHRSFIQRVLLSLCGFILMMTLISPGVKAETGGFGVSGSFSSYTFKMVPGEQITTKDVNVVFFNNYDQDIRVSLETNGPKGVTFLLKNSIIKIKANSRVTIPVSLKLDKTAVAGTYELGLVAQILPDEVTGIQLLGSAQLKTKLIILGEAAEVSFTTIGKDNKPFVADIRVFRINDSGGYDPVSDSESGLLLDRLVPGDYIVFAYYEGTEIAREEFTLKDKDVLTLDLKVQTVFISVFLVGPQFDEKTDKIKNAKFVYTIKNIYQVENNVKVMVEVLKGNSLIEDLEMMTLSEIPLGETQGTYSYIPPEGWTNSIYRFRLHLNTQEDISLASSDVKELRVSGLPESVDHWLGILGGSALGLSALSWFILLYKRRKKVDSPEPDESVSLK